MKSSLLGGMLIICMIIIACQEQQSEADTTTSTPFFDAVTYYHAPLAADTALLNSNGDTLSQLALLQQSIWSGKQPKTLADSNVLDQLAAVNYTTQVLPDSLHDSLTKIFWNKENKDLNPSGRCIPIYRDIFAFKKAGAIVGIAKICFTCLQQRLVGEELSKSNFMDASDYDNLEALLVPFQKMEE